MEAHVETRAAHTFATASPATAAAIATSTLMSAPQRRAKMAPPATTWLVGTRATAQTASRGPTASTTLTNVSSAPVRTGAPVMTSSTRSDAPAPRGHADLPVRSTIMIALQARVTTGGRVSTRWGTTNVSAPRGMWDGGVRATSTSVSRPTAATLAHRTVSSWSTTSDAIARWGGPVGCVRAPSTSVRSRPVSTEASAATETVAPSVCARRWVAAFISVFLLYKRV